MVPPSPLRGDSDGDDDIDLADWLTLSHCLTNPAGPPLSGLCSIFDFDFDGALDLADVVAFQAAFTGAR